jgi:DNA end-binding protein Ku
MVDAVGDVVEPKSRSKAMRSARTSTSSRRRRAASIAIESSHTVDIEVRPKSSIDDRYRDAYHLAPEDKVGQEAFAVIRDAMRKKKMVGIARVVMAPRTRDDARAIWQGHHGHDAPLRLRDQE